MVNVISLLESALVMKGFKGLIVLVRFVMKYNNLLYKLSQPNFTIIELKCPGDCNSAGICDTSTGKCTCDDGRHGQDCSSELSRDLSENKTLFNSYF